MIKIKSNSNKAYANRKKEEGPGKEEAGQGR